METFAIPQRYIGCKICGTLWKYPEGCTRLYEFTPPCGHTNRWDDEGKQLVVGECRPTPGKFSYRALMSVDEFRMVWRKLAGEKSRGETGSVAYL